MRRFTAENVDLLLQAASALNAAAFFLRFLRLWEKRKGVTARIPVAEGTHFGAGFGFEGPVPKKRGQKKKEKPGGFSKLRSGLVQLRYAGADIHPVAV